MELRPSSSWVPARALASSSLLHVAVGMAWILLLPALIILLPSPRIAPAPLEIKQASVTLTLTLPPLGAQARGSGRPAAAGKRARGAASASRPASSTTGFTFLGPQPIVSLPRRPDNLLQTVRQPDLPKPPKLKVRLASPNILQMAAPAPPLLAPQPAVLEIKARANAGEHIPLQPRPSEAVPVPKLRLPVSGDPASKSVGALMVPATRPTLAEQPPPPAPVSGEGRDRRNLLVLSAMPAPGPPPPIPAGEMAGAFSVSPEGNPGTRAGTATANAPGAGVKGTGAAGTGSGNAASPGGGPGTGSGSSGNEGSGGAVAGKGSGTGPGNAGHGPGGGTGTGTGSGPADRGSGNASVSGGSGGPGNGTFPGVTIGAAPAVNPANAPPRIPVPRGTYSMTIVATGGSGGGVGDFGIFKNQVAYTVYLDVAEPGHPRPKWTLQYASATPGTNSIVVAPFPTAKEYPHLPVQALARNIGRKLIVTGLITKEGKFDSLRVLQSPNPLLIQPLLDCLAQWTFQAAESGGEQVAVRFVLGIPITAELLSAY